MPVPLNADRLQEIGLRYVGEIRSRGLVEGRDGVQDDAPFAVGALLRRDRDSLPTSPRTVR